MTEYFRAGWQQVHPSTRRKTEFYSLQEQQLLEIQLRRQERERRAAEEDARDDSPPIQERADELTGPFHFEFSYWARSVSQCFTATDPDTHGVVSSNAAVF